MKKQVKTQDKNGAGVPALTRRVKGLLRQGGDGTWDLKGKRGWRGRKGSREACCAQSPSGPSPRQEPQEEPAVLHSQRGLPGWRPAKGLDLTQVVGCARHRFTSPALCKTPQQSLSPIQASVFFLLKINFFKSLEKNWTEEGDTCIQTKKRQVYLLTKRNPDN